MKRIALALIVAILPLILSSCRTTILRPAPITFAPTFFSTVIPEIKMDAVTIEEAINTVCKRWQEQTGATHLPIIVNIRYKQCFVPNNDIRQERPGQRETFSFEAKQITVAECLDIISGLSRHTITIKGRAIGIEEWQWGEDWTTRTIHVSKTAAHVLGLSDKTSQAELVAILRSYGVHFEEWMEKEARWIPQVSVIVMTNLPEEFNNIRGLLHLVDEGFEIKKVKAQQHL